MLFRSIALEPSEIPEEYRLLFDAPILAAYQYSGGDFTLNKLLKPLDRQDSLEQVADRATFLTQVSNDGQVVTTATYFLKNRGHAHFKVSLEAGIELWETKVAGKRVIPITQVASESEGERETILVPLPKGQNLNVPIEVSLKFAPKPSNDVVVRVTLPQVGSPLLLSNWNVTPDQDYRLEFEAGSVKPTNERSDLSGFARLKQGEWRAFLLPGFAAFIGGLLVRCGTRTGRHRWDLQNLLGQLFGWPLVLGALVLLGFTVIDAMGLPLDVEPWLVFTSSVLEANEALSITVKNIEADAPLYSYTIFLPAVVGIGIWVYRFQSDDDVVIKGVLLVGWLFIAWTTLMVPNEIGRASCRERV